MAKRPSEFKLIAELFAPLATSKHALGLKDDAATLPLRLGQDIVATVDAVIAGVHFLANDPPATVAQKALRVNLSDLAAKGAQPAGYLMSLSLPPSVDVNWLRTFAGGLSSDQQKFGIMLLGGDTTRTPGPLAIAITAFGFVPKGKMIKRSDAKSGDLVFVTGTIGDGAGGLAVAKGDGHGLSQAVRNHLLSRYRVPRPRCGLGPLLRGVVSAAADVSDGLLADLGHIAETSHVRAVVDADAVPRSGALHALWGDGREALVKAMTGGDDYEIVFTAPPRAEHKVMAAAAKSGVMVSRIGHIERGTGVILRDMAGKQIKTVIQGWTQF